MLFLKNEQLIQEELRLLAELCPFWMLSVS